MTDSLDLRRAATVLRNIDGMNSSWVQQQMATAVSRICDVMADQIEVKSAYPLRDCRSCDGRGQLLAYPMRDDTGPEKRPDLKIERAFIVPCPVCKGSGHAAG